MVTWGYAYLHWWLQPICKVKMGIFSPNRDENKNYLKPPPSYHWIKNNTSLKTPVNTCEPSIGFIHDLFLAPGHRTAASSICWYRPLAIDPSGVGQWKHDDVGICCRLLLQSRDWLFLLCSLTSGCSTFSTMLPVKPAILPASSTCCEYHLYTKKSFYPLIQAFGNPQPE